MRIGSTCSGYGGLERAALALFPTASVAWHSEINPDASRILEHHWPGVPNYGDLTTIDWATVEPVDILAGGFPCQDVSTAGRRAGLRPGTRTGIWTQIAYGISVLRPRLVLLENVGGLLSAGAHSDMEPCPWCVGDAGSEHVLRALGAVLGDLASLGYDASWVCIRASDVGAPHGRARVFIAAAPVDAGHPAGSPERWLESQEPSVRIRESDPVAPPDPDSLGHERGRRARDGRAGSADGGLTPPDASRDGRDEGRPEPARLQRGPHAPVSGNAPTDAHGNTAEAVGLAIGMGAEHTLTGGSECPLRWGPYGPAIARWERVLGRRAPRPTEPGRTGRERLSPRFVEWMQGLPDGWVTDPAIGISRNAQLTALGNGVVPQQAEAAYRILLEHLRAMEAA